jgi:hypothetical protein
MAIVLRAGLPSREEAFYFLIYRVFLKSLKSLKYDYV